MARDPSKQRSIAASANISMNLRRGLAGLLHGYVESGEVQELPVVERRRIYVAAPDAVWADYVSGVVVNGKQIVIFQGVQDFPNRDRIGRFGTIIVSEIEYNIVTVHADCRLEGSARESVHADLKLEVRGFG